MLRASHAVGICVLEETSVRARARQVIARLAGLENASHGRPLLLADLALELAPSSNRIGQTLQSFKLQIRSCSILLCLLESQFSVG